MENENNTNNTKRDYLMPVSIILSAVILALAWTYKAEPNKQSAQLLPEEAQEKILDELEGKVLPQNGVTLPVRWKDLGQKLLDSGVIDKEKFEKLYKSRGILEKEALQLLENRGDEYMKINSQNAAIWLNLLWALGLGNKNQVLEKGPMVDSKYGGAGIFASTGGWTLARGNAMDYYSKHSFVVLTSEQQALVEKVSKNIYRPCCNNSTYFPDCNHGMAMLGLLELMASQGLSEEQMYKVALQVNSFWFADTYLTIAQYFKKKGIDWSQVDAKEVLGSGYSSGSGFQKILKEVQPPASRGGQGCGV